MISRLRIMIFCIALSACAQPFPAAEECNDNTACYIQHTINTLKVISSQIDYWDNITLVAALIAGISGIVATIMIALQGDDNRVWTRPIGIIATALVTGITALVTSFHIPESKDKYISAYSRMLELNNKFEHDIRASKTADEQDELRFQYTIDFSKIKVELLQTKGSLSLVRSNPAPATQPQSKNH